MIDECDSLIGDPTPLESRNVNDNPRKKKIVKTPDYLPESHADDSLALVLTP